MKEIKAGAITCPNKHYEYKTHADVLKIMTARYYGRNYLTALANKVLSRSSYHRGEFTHLKGVKYSQLN